MNQRPPNSHSNLFTRNAQVTHNLGALASASEPMQTDFPKGNDNKGYVPGSPTTATKTRQTTQSSTPSTQKGTYDHKAAMRFGIQQNARRNYEAANDRAQHSSYPTTPSTQGNSYEPSLPRRSIPSQSQLHPFMKKNVPNKRSISSDGKVVDQTPGGGSKKPDNLKSGFRMMGAGSFVKGAGGFLTGIGGILDPIYAAEVAKINAENDQILQERDIKFKNNLERGRFSASLALQAQLQKHSLKRMSTDFGQRATLMGLDIDYRSRLSKQEHAQAMSREQRREKLFSDYGIPEMMLYQGGGLQRTQQYLGSRTVRTFLPTKEFYDYNYAQRRLGIGQVDMSQFGKGNYTDKISNPPPLPQEKKKKKPKSEPFDFGRNTSRYSRVRPGGNT